MLKKLFCASALIAVALLTPAHARNVFVTAGDSGGSTLSTYTTDPFSFVGSIAAAPNSFLVLAAPSGTKYYVVGRSASDTVVVLEGNFTALQVTKRLSLGSAATAAAMTPDGRRLVVVTANNTAIIDTTTDTQIGTIDTGSNANSVAVSLDGTRAYVLSPTSQRLTAIDLTTNTIAGTITVAASTSGVAAAPNGLIYVSGQNAIYELDGRTLAQRGSIAVSALSGPLTFTPDGRFGLSVNQTLSGSSSIQVIDLVRRVVATVPSQGIIFDKVIAIDNGRALAISSQAGRIYQIFLDPTITAGQGVGLFEASFAGTTISNARDLAISEELPQARYIYIRTSSTIYRFDAYANQLSSTGLPGASGNISYAGPAATGAAVSYIQYNASQSVASGGTSLPLVIRALDAQGRPVSNAPVTFSTTSGVSLSSTTATTNAAGYASTSLVIPTSMTSGTISIVAALTGTGLSTPFQISIGTATTGGGTPSSSVAGIQILSGQGQVLPVSFSTFNQESMVIVVRDANGVPVPNVPITWSLTQGAGTLHNFTSVTDSNGQAVADFTTTLVQQGQSFTQAIVNASTGTDSVNFYITTLANQASGQPGALTVLLLRPASRVLSGKAGEVIPAGLQAQVFASNGQPIPNVGIHIVDPDRTQKAAASCKDEFTLTDSGGSASCDVVIGGRIGDSPAIISVGAAINYPITVRIAPGDATNLRIIQGNGCTPSLTQACNPTGLPGQRLPVALIAEITDAFGNPLPGTQVTWEVVTPNGGTLSNVVSRADSSGRVSASFTLGSVAGPVQIRLKAGTGSTTFTVNASVNIARIEAINDSQSAQVNQAFSQPLTVRLVDDNGNGVAGQVVTFTISSGSGALSSATATTDAGGRASVTLTAGGTAGPITVTALGGGKQVTFNSLTIRPAGPRISNSRIVNAAGFQTGIAPGTIAAILGTGISNGISGIVTPPDFIGPLPTRLAGVEVLFNGISAPIYSVSNVNGQEEINVQVPFEVQPGTATIEIRTGATSQTLSNVTVQPLAPGVFETNENGRRYAVIVREDGSFVSPSNPARRGEKLRAYATGLGQVTGGTATNRAATPGQSVLTPIIVGVNNAGYPATAEYVAGVVGVYTVAFTVPNDVPSGSTLPFVLAETGPDGRLVFSNGSNLAVQ
ncbi:MAG TPA: Ig-like domain-containing protein [Bryobacteraceae bacterium]|nr:Ig-like domain-containing protein [Bryobacteraceae bacterium]